jgi:hypothetical protein
MCLSSHPLSPGLPFLYNRENFLQLYDLFSQPYHLYERGELAVAYPVEFLEILPLEPCQAGSTLSKVPFGLSSFKREADSRDTLPSEFFEVLRQVFALVGSTLSLDSVTRDGWLESKACTSLITSSPATWPALIT